MILLYGLLIYNRYDYNKWGNKTLEQILRDLIEESINNKNEDENILIFLNEYSDEYEFVEEYLDGVGNIDQILDRDEKTKEDKDVDFDGLTIIDGFFIVIAEGIMYSMINSFFKNEKLEIIIFIAINMVLIFDFIVKRTVTIKSCNK